MGIRSLLAHGTWREPEVSVPVDAVKIEQEARASERKEVVAEVTRLLVSAPVPSIPTANTKSPYGAYALDQPIRYSTPQAPTRRPGSLITIESLRTLADTYDILRSCINHLKREVIAVPIEIVSRDPKKDNQNVKRRKAEAEALFAIHGPVGGRGEKRRHFESKLIEDVSVVGAGAVYYERTRGGDLYSSVAIDASTIRPFVDAYGWPPTDDGPYADHVYEQWIYGVQAATFGRANLTYDGIYPTSYSPYFHSPVEWLVYTIDSALRTDNWNRTWLTSGNTPADMMALPEAWTPDQIQEYAEFFDLLLAGDSSARQKMKFVPGGSQRVASNGRKDQDFTEFELWLLRRTCSIMGVQPASIGFAGEQYKVSQDGSMDQTTQFGAGTILTWRKDLYDEILARAGYDDYECVNVTGREDDAKTKAETNEILIRSGQRTINECRKADGEDALTDEGASEPLVANTLTTLALVVTPPAPPEPIGVSGTGDDDSDPKKGDTNANRVERAEGEGNPNHDPKNGQFTSGGGGGSDQPSGGSSEAPASAKSAPAKETPEQIAARTARVMGKLPKIAEGVPKMRAAIETDLQKDGLTKERVGAVVARIMDATTMRVGSEKYATKSARGEIAEGSKSQDSFGASSLRKQHVSVDGDTVKFSFPGKSRKNWEREIKDPHLARGVNELMQTTGDRLMQYHDSKGALKPFTEVHAGEYLEPHGITPKNLRTYHATEIAHRLMADYPAPKNEKEAEKHIVEVATAVSNHLGNTPAIARQSYINPAVFEVHKARMTGS